MTDLPISVDAEQALLGAVLMNSDAYYLASEIIDVECFAVDLHAKLWEMIQHRMDSGRKVDPVQLIVSMGPDAEERIEDITVREYIVRLATHATSVVGAPDYALTLRDLWKRRRVISLAQQMEHRCNGGFDGTPVEDLLEEMDLEFSSIRFGNKAPGIVKMDEAVTSAINLTAKVYQGGFEPGIESRVEDIARMLGPLMPGDLVTCMAASGNGKTALAGQFMTDAALPVAPRTPVTSLMFSQEMLAVQIARRAIAAESGISTGRQRKAQIDVADFDTLTTAARKVETFPIYIDQTANQKVSTIVRKARHMKKLYGIGFVVVDHLLEIRAEHPRDSKFDTIENAALALKTLAKEENLTVLLLAQLTREGQKREHWRVRSQDLFGGDSVKQRSDVMFSVSIPTTFIAEREPVPGTEEHFKWQDEMEKWHGKAEVSVLKARDGAPGGRVTVGWDGVRQTFSNAEFELPLPSRIGD